MSTSDVEKGMTERVASPASRQASVQGPGLRPLAKPAPLWVFYWIIYIRDASLNPFPFRRGLFSFASTTLILSLYNVNVRHVNTPNVVVGMAVGVGGLLQVLAGMWEFACGNTFGATVRTNYSSLLSCPWPYFLGILLIRWFLAVICVDLYTRLWHSYCVWREQWGCGPTSWCSWYLSHHLVHCHCHIPVSIFLRFRGANLIPLSLSVASIRTHLAFNALFGFLALTFMLLAIG